ncbi:MAG TPA: DUF3800 domain-containing protein [Thermomicrobiales bacterium]
MKLLFLDESGDHSLEAIDQDYPVFVLGGIVVDRTYYRIEMEPRVRDLKEEFFDDPDIILHTTDIIRGKNGFEVLGNPVVRAAFSAALNAVMQDLEYEVIACGIRKVAHLQQYGVHAADPYMYSLGIVVERFCHAIGDTEEGGMIFAEKRRPDLDHELDLAWKKLREWGSDYVSPVDIDKRIVDLSLKSKQLNVVGLQLADLVVSPIGRHLIGKIPRDDWAIVESKFRRVGGRYQGYGLVVRPR